MTRPGWDFEYLPVPRTLSLAIEEHDFVVATGATVTVDDLRHALGARGVDCTVEVLLLQDPIYWLRVRTVEACTRRRLDAILGETELPLRYVASSTLGSLELGIPARFEDAQPPGIDPTWRARGACERAEAPTPGRWFVWARQGADVDRDICGTGAGTRLAVVDDVAGGVDTLELDAERFLGPPPGRGTNHAASMVAWAVGTRGRDEDRLQPYIGVAPDASSRVYWIPKSEDRAFWLPLGIIKAASEGADVIVCATYIDGMNSPMLDDALEFATRLGREGRGSAVIFPTSREISSAPGAACASLTLGIGEPASDPRVLCVAPSGRGGAWFRWTDKRGVQRPFSNRGPAVRLAAPGDDVLYPFTNDERLGHTESSGASAIAAGVALLVLGQNPELTVTELYEVLSASANPCDEPDAVRADRADLLPASKDPDGHDAKCGYGRASATRSCLTAVDPIPATLIAIGEEAAARQFAALAGSGADWPYSKELARWAASLCRRDPCLAHELRVLFRHLRLLAHHDDRKAAQASGALARLVGLLIGSLLKRSCPADLRRELERHQHRVLAATRSQETAAKLEAGLLALASALWPARNVTVLLSRSHRPAVGGIERSA